MTSRAGAGRGMAWGLVAAVWSEARPGRQREGDLAGVHGCDNIRSTERRVVGAVGEPEVGGRHGGPSWASLNETIKEALAEAVERRRRDPAFKKRLREIIDQDRELLERLAR